MSNTSCGNWFAGTEKAARGVDLSQLGYDQIHELELLVKVKELTVQEALRALEAAEHDLDYTRVRAPFSGVVDLISMEACYFEHATPARSDGKIVKRKPIPPELQVDAPSTLQWLFHGAFAERDDF